MHDKDTDSVSKGSNYSNEPAQGIGSRNCCVLEAIHWDALYDGRATGWEECMASAEDSAGKIAKGAIIEERDAATTYVSFDPQQHTKQSELVEQTRRVRRISNRSPKSARGGCWMVILCENCGIKVH